MEALNKRYDLKIGYLGKNKFFTLFDEKLECNIYQIKINGNKLEEYYPSFNIDNSKQKAKKTENRVVPKKVQMQIIDLAKQDIKEERIFLVGCSANKKDGFWNAEDLYTSSRITFAKNLSRETNTNLYILSAKFGIVSNNTLLPNYDLKMDENISNFLYPKVLKQLRLKKISEIVFFKAGINKYYYELMQKACNELNINLTAIGTGCMGGAKEIKEILKVS